MSSLNVKEHTLFNPCSKRKGKDWDTGVPNVFRLRNINTVSSSKLQNVIIRILFLYRIPGRTELKILNNLGVSFVHISFFNLNGCKDSTKSTPVSVTIREDRLFNVPSGIK